MNSLFIRFNKTIRIKLKFSNFASQTKVNFNALIHF